MLTTMDKLKKGEGGTVICLQPGAEAFKHRLLSMGLTPGTSFEIVRVAPLGDPIEIKVRGFCLSMRKGEAQMINIEQPE